MSDRPVLELGDTQGLILREYDFDHVRHLVLRLRDPKSSREFIGQLVGGSDPESPRVTTADEESPEHCLSVGFTYAGLLAVGLTTDALRSFGARFKAFADGPIDRWFEGPSGRTLDPDHLIGMGDVGDSAPDEWYGAQDGVWNDAHVLLSIYAKSAESVQSLSATVAKLLEQYGIKVLLRTDGFIGRDKKEHFGFRDGISQPQIGDAPAIAHPDRTGDVPAGEFLLGYPNVAGITCELPPAKLVHNGSFAAFRILKQDVARFRGYVKKTAGGLGIEEDLLMARMCGRWPNGEPLVESPDGDQGIPEDRLNDFDYSADPDGARCPFGSHLRRTNPRDSKITPVRDPRSQRLIRRSTSYDLKNGDQGFLGLFICADLEAQFEFVQKAWINGWAFNGQLQPLETDPILPPMDGSAVFSFATDEGQKTIHGLSQFVATRGSLYCLLPGIEGLRYLSSC